MGFGYFFYSFVCKCFENIFDKRLIVVDFVKVFLKIFKIIEGKIFGNFVVEKIGFMLFIQFDYKFKFLVLGEFGVGKILFFFCFLDFDSLFFDVLVLSIIVFEEYFQWLFF